MATLVLLQGGEAVPSELNTRETVIGRHPDCEMKLQSNMVSRKHARILSEGTLHYLEDMGSGNGTFVNGRKIEERTLLKNHDRIKLGPILLRYESNDPQAQPATTASALLSSSGAGFGDVGIDIATDSDDSSTIVGSIDSVSGFGMLDVRPEIKLKAVLDIARSLAGTVDLETLWPKILETLFEIFPQADRGCILLKDGDSDGMIPKAIRHRRETNDDSVKLSRTILNKVLEEKAGILSADAASDSRFEASESISNLTIRSMMCVPLLSLQEDPMGVINIDTQNPLNQFKSEDLDLLMAVAGQAALSYESALLLVSHIEKQKQDNEMRIAESVQRALLPEELPEVPGYEFYANYEAAQAVGGDYYDCFLLGQGKVCLAFGDVAGKGVPASIVMSRLYSVVRTTLEFVHKAGDAVNRINDHMCTNAVEGRFVTFVLTILDTNSDTISVVNAGHMSPVIRSEGGTLEEFDEETVGLPLGVLEDYSYTVNHRKLKPGDTVVIYTDGISEAMNAASELYGVDRLRSLIAQSSSGAADLGQEILSNVKQHANGRAQNDDITLMVFGRCSE